MNYLNYLQQNFKISEEVLFKIDAHITHKIYQKGEEIIAPNNFSKQVYFIEEGLARTFYYKAEKKITFEFMEENRITTAIDSVFYQSKSPYGLDALLPTRVAIIPYKIIEELSLEYQEVNIIMKSLLVEILLLFSKRIQSIQFDSATERYQKFLTERPDILLKAPLGDVASYLGITQQTLSIIRSKK